MLAQRLEQHHSAMAIATIIEKKGSVPQQIGAKMLIAQDQILPLYGTIGGGNLEHYAIKFMHEQLVSQKMLAQIVTLNLQNDLAMHCGGEVTLLFEFFSRQKPWQIVVFGAGHIAQALVPLLCQLEALIYCVDDRQEWLAQMADRDNLIKIQLNFQEVERQFLVALKNRDETFFICLNRTHQLDFTLCKTLYQGSKPAYVGVIGSKSKAEKLSKELNNDGLAKKALSSLHCPIGSNHSHSPFEIAVDICAQIVQARALITKNGALETN